MASPFPGMDPFLEDQVWREFHNPLIGEIQGALIPLLRPRYVARIEVRVYPQYEPHEGPGPVRPDVTVLRETGRTAGASGTGTTVINPPILIPLPMPEEMKESYLEVRLRETHRVISVIELLSPSNKRAGSEGRREYLAKREAVRRSQTHLVEIDPLRRGDRAPKAAPLPPCDYRARVTRSQRRPVAQAWPLTIRQPLPVIPVPLVGSDPDAPWDLQEVLSRAYNRAGYDYSVGCGAPLKPPLAPKTRSGSRG